MIEKGAMIRKYLAITFLFVIITTSVTIAPFPIRASSWTPSVKVSDADGSGIYGNPAIAVDKDGNLYSIWEDMRDRPSGDIYFSYKPRGGTWEQNVKITDTSARPGGIGPNSFDIAVDPEGNAYAVWPDTRAGWSFLYYSYRPANGNWGPNLQLLSNYGGDQYYPKITIDPAGNIYLIWVGTQGNAYHIYFSYKPLGDSWEMPARVDDDLNQNDIHTMPSLSVNKNGDACAIWYDTRNIGSTGADFYASCKQSSGAWSPNEKVNDTPQKYQGTTYMSAIALDNQGDALAIWQGQGLNGVSLDSAYKPKDSIWEPSIPISDPYAIAAWYPSLTVDNSGKAYASWNAAAPTWHEAFATWENGLWSAETTINDPGANPTAGSDIAVDNLGNVHVVWGDTRNYPLGDIYYSMLPNPDNIPPTVSVPLTT